MAVHLFDDVLMRSINELQAQRNKLTDQDQRDALSDQIDRLFDERAVLIQIALDSETEALDELIGTLTDIVRDLERNVPSHILAGLRGMIGATGRGHATARLPRTDDDPDTDPTVAPAQRMQALAAVMPTTVPAVGAAQDWGTPVKAGRSLDVLRDEYDQLFESCVIDENRIPTIERYYIRPLVENEGRYRAVSVKTGVPWWVVGIIHGLEAGFSFKSHLHNGDPLDQRTVQVPAGRPKTGQPPFTWEESAQDALTGKFGVAVDWSLAGTLFNLELYNGLGYRNRGRATPYLWAFTNHHRKGKFVKDGVFDPEALTRQAGAAAILKRALDRKLIDLPQGGAAAAAPVAVDPPATAAVRLAAALAPRQPGSDDPTVVKELAFPGLVRRGDKLGRTVNAVTRVQEWCALHGFDVAIDGDFGDGTERAVRKFQETVAITPTGIVDAATWDALTRPMRSALEPVPLPANAGLGAVVVAVAERHLAAKAREVGGDNRGPWVRLYMHGNQGTEWRWCAGFVCFVVGQACALLGIGMPFDPTFAVDTLRTDAVSSGRVVAPQSLGTPRARPDLILPGMIYLENAATGSDYSHTGIVKRADSSMFVTLEGNATNSGNAGLVTSRDRNYDNKAFLRLV
ncbi:hypothetical protein HL658_25725 [Azospirillum sp. RWY-5-1]|uniref:Peptidoglycan binding-like domain-containing protein n=1 Tax=Azospirillum oleiclasticum TaxID=2735135 RepID=A0ABX2TH37_9PROT|nr:peptidoglycan-binding protein [Azospirillum oleiclasticum]NYZ15955.1 hypothetical protein [Azospirillum oleiclasticum]NYZ23566.1 hypothetical protein [Azospirillum oleiclasticum]